MTKKKRGTNFIPADLRLLDYLAHHPESISGNVERWLYPNGGGRPGKRGRNKNTRDEADSK